MSMSCAVIGVVSCEDLKIRQIEGFQSYSTNIKIFIIVLLFVVQFCSKLYISIGGYPRSWVFSLDILPKSHHPLAEGSVLGLLLVHHVPVRIDRFYRKLHKHYFEHSSSVYTVYCHRKSNKTFKKFDYLAYSFTNISI